VQGAIDVTWDARVKTGGEVVELRSQDESSQPA
jgi:hypothetical protein